MYVFLRVSCFPLGASKQAAEQVGVFCESVWFSKENRVFVVCLACVWRRYFSHFFLRFDVFVLVRMYSEYIYMRFRFSRDVFGSLWMDSWRVLLHVKRGRVARRQLRTPFNNRGSFFLVYARGRGGWCNVP